MEPTVILGLVVGIVSAIAILPLLVRLWPKDGKWGINSKPVHCPECGEAFPRVRKPANRRQALWGGWTCTNGGTAYDKYGGRVIETDR